MRTWRPAGRKTLQSDCWGFTKSMHSPGCPPCACIRTSGAPGASRQRGTILKDLFVRQLTLKSLCKQRNWPCSCAQTEKLRLRAHGRDPELPRYDCLSWCYVETGFKSPSKKKNSRMQILLLNWSCKIGLRIRYSPPSMSPFVRFFNLGNTI